MKEETRKAAKEAAEECYKRYSQEDSNYDDEGYFYVSLIEDIYMEAVEWAMAYNGKQGCKAGKKKKSGIQQIADELATLSPREVEILRFACDNDNPVVHIRD